MAQHDYTIANQGFPDTRSDINSALSAIVSQNSGDTAPSTTYANQMWYDSANNFLKMRNEDNDAWINLFTLNQTADTATASISSVDVASGGTGASTFTTNGVLFGNGTSAIGATATGTTGQILTSNGSGSAPTFQDAGGGGKTIALNQKALGYHSSSSMTASTLPSNWFISHSLANSANALLIAGYASTYNPNCSGNMYVGIELRQDGTQLSESSAPDSGTVQFYGNSYFSSQNYMNPIYIETLIKPGDTSAHNYQLYVYSNTGQQGGATVSWSQAYLRLTEIDGSICTVD